MPLEKFKGLQARLFIIVLLAMLPVLLLALYLAVQDHRDAKAQAIESCKQLARGYLNKASGSALLDRARTVLTDLSRLPGLEHMDAESCARFSGSLDTGHTIYSHIDLHRPDGRAICQSSSGHSHATALSEDGFRKDLNEKGFAVGRYQTDALGRPELPVALAVKAPDGAVRMVFSMGLRLESLAAILDEQVLPEGAAVSLIDRAGTILARYPNTPAAVGQDIPEADRLLAELLGKGSDIWQAVGVDGVERIYYIAPLYGQQEQALYLRMGLPADAAFAQANRNFHRNLGFLGAMAAVVLVATWVFSNALVLRHIKTIWLATRKLSDGNYSYRIGARGGGELGELALAFDHMAGVLEERTAQLSKTEQNYRHIFEHSVNGIFQTSVSGSITIANQSLANIMGYSSPEEMSACISDLSTQFYAQPEDRYRILSRLESEGTVAGLEVPAKRTDGGIVWLSLDARAVRDLDNRFIGAEGMVSDITLRKGMELELESKREKLQALLDYSPALISIKDASGRYLLSNRRHQELRSLDQPVVGRLVGEVFPEEQARQILEEDAAVLAAGQAMTFEHPIQDRSGMRHFVTVKFPLRDETGCPNRVGSISHDVTDLELAREALRQSEEKFRTMIQTSPDLIWYIDPQGLLVEVNCASRDLIGYEPEELRGRHFHLFFFPEDLREHDRDQVLPQLVGRARPDGQHPKFINERRQLARSTRNLNLQLIPKGGLGPDADVRNFELAACGLWREMQFMGTIVVIRDITERRRAEAALQRSQDLLNQTQAMARIVGWTMDLDTRASSWTQQAEEMFGLDGVRLHRLLVSGDFLAEDDRELFRTALWRLEAEGEPFDLELRRAQNGGPPGWVRVLARRASDENARLVSCAIQDITDRKLLEQLRADIDNIIRHDLKAPLNGIINLPQLMKGDENLTEAQVESLQFIEDCGQNMLRQVEMSLDLMKIERGQYVCAPTRCDLVPVLREILGVLADSARVKRVEVELRLNGLPLMADSEFPVWGEARLCYPLLTNLIVNALEASPAGEAVQVDLVLGEWGLLAVRNKGEVPPEIRPRFFAKYATMGKTAGTGLGTYSALLFAKAQGGSVELNAREPGATTVIVRLPRSQRLG